MGLRKIRVYPKTREQRKILDELCGASRYYYNKTVEYLRKPDTKASRFAIQKELLSNVPEWAEKVPYKVKQMAIDDACIAVRNAKKKSKMKALRTKWASRVDVVPSGGVIPGLGDNKVGYIVVEGRGWLDMPVTLDLKLRVQDSSNASGVVVDLIRLAQGALDRGLKGAVPLSYYFKNPVGGKLVTKEAIEEIRRFDRGEGI